MSDNGKVEPASTFGGVKPEFAAALFLLVLTGMAVAIGVLGQSPPGARRAEAPLTKPPAKDAAELVEVLSCAGCHAGAVESRHRTEHRLEIGCFECHAPESAWEPAPPNSHRTMKALTLDEFHRAIKSPGARAASLQVNCLHCHGPTVHGKTPRREDGTFVFNCFPCHNGTGHSKPGK